MTPQETLLAVAAKEVGVKERPAGSNKVKYNTWYYGRAVTGSSYPWCCVFVCWCFKQAGMYDLIGHTAGCTSMMNWFKARGRLMKPREARPGDVVFYQFDKDSYADHVGIVERVTKTGVVAIEGNTSLTSNDNGGSVMRRNRKWGLIMGIGRPAYEGEKKEEEEMTQAEVTNLVRQELSTMTQKQTYDRVEDCPAWARTAVNWAVDRGFIRGDGTGKLGLDNTKLWALQVTYNVIERRRE